MTELTLTGILHALSDESRLEMVRRLAVSDVDIACGRLYDGLAKSTASYHFSVLREAGVIEQYQESGQKWNRLRRVEIDTLAPGMLASILAALDG